ncbi:Pzf1p [Kluyveromyces lactis]|uniref:Transcription factor IIIA n=1 Tax=Kluyveromyces lactis (strain ATCC 8585 / CBS 2359 / DSM 70799 / NBRC 1267 / NRRL Y-1140 / WM37) TaxID=284590 RepID=Q6CWK1_KLULA|nr:uncharacterized protein KLLA0_B03454g [Kluyveromyces lactis]CAH02081.1 KLLA0B03454p [Kluyveromyces lactis]|eukprot:XP_451688.1 uncharacterized protein KLLA0_B03454g [Kluyveromyces lactis]
MKFIEKTQAMRCDWVRRFTPIHGIPNRVMDYLGNVVVATDESVMVAPTYNKENEVRQNVVGENDDDQQCCVPTPPLTRSESMDSVMSMASVTSTVSVSSSQRSKVYFCDYQGCNKSFTRPSLLTEHQLTVHHGIKPFKCDTCGKEFAKKSHLNRHMFSHTDDKPFTCSICGKGVTTRQQLKRHEITHTKSFHCSYEGCNESFYKHPQLRSHILSVHEKKLTCPHCNKTFQRPYRLKNHIDKHHNPESTGMYQCDFLSCTDVFSTWSSLQQHIKQCHPKLPCPICGKPCVAESGLRNHMMIHDESLVTKNWKCSSCPDTSFAKKTQLVQHYEESHKDVDPELLLLPTDADEDTNIKVNTDIKISETEDSFSSGKKTLLDFPSFSKKRKVDELGSVEAEIKIKKYIESGKTTKSLLLNTVGQKRKCPYTNCNRTFKSKEKFDTHIEKHKIHELKMKILEDENQKSSKNDHARKI